MSLLKKLSQIKGYRLIIPDTKNIITNSFVKKLRNSFNMTQRAFAIALGVSEKTVEKWEKEGNSINDSSRKLMYLLNKHNYLMKDLYEFIDEKKVTEFKTIKSSYSISLKNNKNNISKLSSNINIQNDLDELKFKQVPVKCNNISTIKYGA